MPAQRNTTEDDFGGMYELDLTEVEREICRLPDVSISRRHARLRLDVSLQAIDLQ